MKHTFDWHKEPQTSFLHWAVLHIVSEGKRGDGLFDQLSEATDKFRGVELGITINGIEVDAKAFTDRLDKAVDWGVEREAKKLIEQAPRLDELYETLHELERAFREEVIRAAAEAGIELDREDWR